MNKLEPIRKMPKAPGSAARKEARDVSPSGEYKQRGETRKNENDAAIIAEAEVALSRARRALAAANNDPPTVPASRSTRQRGESQKDRDEAGVIARATEVIGDKQEALRWMGTPIRALDYATPISLLNDKEGRNAVLAVLTRIEHGVL